MASNRIAQAGQTDIMRRPKKCEVKTLTGNQVTDWRQCVILCLTASAVLSVRDGKATRQTIKTKLKAVRSELKAEGWQFIPNPASKTFGGLDRDCSAYQKAIPPRGYETEVYEAEVTQAEATWAAEVARQTRSTWGMRVRPGKAAGN